MPTTIMPTPSAAERVEAEREKLIEMLRRGYDSARAGRTVSGDELERQLDAILAEETQKQRAATTSR